MKKLSFIVVIAVLIGLMYAPVQAREGLYLGALVPKVSWSGDIQGLDSGTGFGVRGGIGLGRYLAVEGTLFQTSHDAGTSPTWDYRSSAVDLLILFPLSGSGAEPYLRGGLGLYELKNGPSSYTGDGNQFGIGLNFYLFPELSLNAGYTRTRVTFDEGTSPKATARTIEVGIAYHFY